MTHEASPVRKTDSCLSLDWPTWNTSSALLKQRLTEISDIFRYVNTIMSSVWTAQSYSPLKEELNIQRSLYCPLSPFIVFILYLITCTPPPPPCIIYLFIFTQLFVHTLLLTLYRSLTRISSTSVWWTLRVKLSRRSRQTYPDTSLTNWGSTGISLLVGVVIYPPTPPTFPPATPNPFLSWDF